MGKRCWSTVVHAKAFVYGRALLLIPAAPTVHELSQTTERRFPQGSLTGKSYKLVPSANLTPFTSRVALFWSIHVLF